jgi:hypothetical protein
MILLIWAGGICVILLTWAGEIYMILPTWAGEICMILLTWTLTSGGSTRNDFADLGR